MDSATEYQKYGITAERFAQRIGRDIRELADALEIAPLTGRRGRAFRVKPAIGIQKGMFAIAAARSRRQRRT